MRTETEVQKYGLMLAPVDDYTSAHITLNVNDGVVSVYAHVNVPATLNMNEDERGLYRVAYAGTYVDCRCVVSGNDSDWNRAMEQLNQIRYHIRNLMELSQNLDTLRRLKEPKGA